MTIRAATPADVPSLLALVRELATFERLAHEVVATEDEVRASLFGDRPAAEVLLAEEAGELQGYVVYFTTYSTFVGRPGLFVEDLYVRPTARQRGVGKALPSRVAVEALARGCARVEGSVLDWNTPAQVIYRSMGAWPLGDWRTWRLGGDALRRLGGAG